MCVCNSKCLVLLPVGYTVIKIHFIVKQYSDITFQSEKQRV